LRSAIGNQQSKILQFTNGPKHRTLPSLVTVAPEGLTFQSKAGFADNLIIEAFRETVVQQKDGTPTNQKCRSLIGFLPAVPIQIVQP